MAATHLVAWTKLIGFYEDPDLAALRNRDVPLPAPARRHARITRGARQIRLRIDTTWRRARAIATAWTRIRAAFPSHRDHP
jgi:hypothetical protein